MEKLLALPVNETFLQLQTSESGLTSEEVQKRLETYGYNELVGRKKRVVVVEFLLHFKSPLTIILLLAGLLSGFFGQVIDTILIFSIVVLSAILDFYQESKAERAAQMLKEKVTTTTTVSRNGSKHEVKLSEIVPGDVIHLSAGDIVPADARVITAKDLFLDESALTGESFPVEKISTPINVKGLTIAEWKNCLFLGTSVASGSGSAVVVKTGNATEYGQIVKKLVKVEPEKEFEKGFRRFGFFIAEITLLLVLFVFLMNALYKREILQSLTFAVALAVGLVPELLPMMLSVNLSKGAIAMSRKGVIVKRLASIQNFGSMDILCTDKTGTLTENRIALALHVDFGGNNDEKVLLYCYLNSYYETGLKSPLDEATLKHEKINAKIYKKIDEIPFDFIRKRVSVVVEQDRERLIITKGAPEEVIKICSDCELVNSTFPMTSELEGRINKTYEELSQKGFRVLGVSYKRIENERYTYSISDEKDMIFLGFAAFSDPPKRTAMRSLRQLENSGIELKILTGDNELVTRHLCEQLQLPIKGIVAGTEIVHMHDDALARVVEQANIFVRVTPVQKDRIINALKRNGHVVGFLGDGINDAPSMRTADIAVSVDNAVDVAKESADMILLRKSLTVLHAGVLEGRRTFGNTMKYVMMGTSSSFGNMFSVAGASLFLPFLPMLPIQILLNNLLYESSQAVIPTDHVDQEYVEKPKRWDVSFVKKFMITFGPISSIFDFATFFIMLFVFNANEPLFQTAWFIESLCTQTLVIFVIRTRRTPFYKSKPSRPLIVSSAFVVGFALLMPFTPIGTLFRFVHLPFAFLVLLGILVGVYLILVELGKKWFYKKILPIK
jgi:Mg2+-importing ATPase